jgi:hypothetical protein
VSSVQIQGRGKQASLLRDAHDWVPGAGTSAASALLMGDAEGLLPLLAYRCFTHQDLTDPSWGFRQPTLDYTVATSQHQTHVVIGSATFNLAGFYAHQDGDGRLCLVPRSSVAALMSVALGKPVRIRTPEDSKIARLLDADGNPRPQVTVDPWVAQAQHANAQPRKRS